MYMANITYSQSRIGAFSNCRLKYKYKYIDDIEADRKGIEAFRGDMIHDVLEEFYKLVKQGAIKPLNWILSKYEELWNKNYTDSIQIVRKEVTVKDHYERGKKALIDFYEKYTPFDQAKVVSTEQPISFKIRYNDNEYNFYGILDRLDWNDKTNMFEIHDYKATGSLMTQEEADTDWQLGLYRIALKDKWPEIKQVKLVWHSLLFNKEIVSSRTEVQLEELQRDVIAEIKKVEECVDFYPKKSALCDWCEYQMICPLWKHPKAMETLPVNDYKKDPGVSLVAKYAELENAKSELKEKITGIETEQEKIKEAAIEFAEKNKISIIEGPESQLKVDIKEELRAPTKTEDSEAWQGLRDLLVGEKKYEEVSTVNNNMLNYRIKIWSKDFLEKIKKYLKKQVIKTVRLIKK